MRRRALLIGLSGGFAAACTGAPPQALATVFAAASLAGVLEAAAQAFGPGRTRTAYAATSALARQIEAGAPADLFISADQRWMDALLAKHLLEPSSVRILAGNRLVLIAPAGGRLPRAPLENLAAALGAGRLALADPAHVPAGRYAEAALRGLGLWGQVQDRLLPAADVRAALALVARGEAPLGVVYRTDALAEPRTVIAAEFPASSHPPIVYPAALTPRAGSAGRAYLDFLAAPEGRAVFARFGFLSQ